MARLVDWIIDMAEGEKVIGVVIGGMGWDDFGSEDVDGYDEMPKGVLLSWEEAAPLLSYSFDDGYGSPGCQAVYAWTESWVIFISEYDGSTSPRRVPRNPANIEPRMV